MKRLLLTATLFALAACATTSGGAKPDAKGKPAEPVMEKMTVSNIVPFDVAACGPRANLDLSVVTNEVLLGAVLSLAPALNECFVDSASVDGAPLDVKLKVTLGETFEADASGPGLTATGKSCLVATAKKLNLKPLAAGAKPLTAEVPVRPDVKPVKMGINAASDAVGLVRLAQPSLCECYAELGTKPAPALVAKLLLAKDKPADVTLDPTEAASVAGCVLPKIKAMKFPAVDATVPYQFLLKNAYATEPTEGAQPALKFQQYDGMRAQRTADVLIAAGRRGSAAMAYDAVVSKYKAKPTPGLIGELRSKCAAVVSADENQLGSLRSLVGTYDASLTLVQGEKAKDPAWTTVEQALTAQRAGTVAEVARIEGQKKADEGACPKSK